MEVNIFENIRYPCLSLIILPSVSIAVWGVSNGQTPLTVAVCVSGGRCESWWPGLGVCGDAAASVILATCACNDWNGHVGQAQWGAGCRRAPPLMFSMWEGLQAEAPPGRARCCPPCWETIFLPALPSSLQTCQASQIPHAPPSSLSYYCITFAYSSLVSQCPWSPPYKLVETTTERSIKSELLVSQGICICHHLLVFLLFLVLKQEVIFVESSLAFKKSYNLKIMMNFRWGIIPHQ